MTVTQIDLMPFCAGEDHPRKAFTRPFVFNGWRYATDGRIAVRIRALGEPDDAEIKMPAAEEVFTGEGRADWTPWPTDGFADDLATCPKCKGRGVMNASECQKCNGAGNRECEECHHVDQCKSCWGRGYVGGAKCTECDGTAQTTQRLYQDIGPARFKLVHVDKILALPNLRYSPASLAHKNRSVEFVFDGGEGRLIQTPQSS